MSKTVKVVIGTVLMTLGTLYLVIMCVLAADARSSAPYRIESYLQVEYKDGRYLGSSAVTDWGEELDEMDRYVYYCLDFEVENLSSEEYYNPPAMALSFKSDFHCEWTYEGKNRDYEKLFAEGAVPNLPGKTSTAARVYLRVREGTEEVTVSYRPNYDEDFVEIPISLEGMKKIVNPKEFDFSPEDVSRAYM